MQKLFNLVNGPGKGPGKGLQFQTISTSLSSPGSNIGAYFFYKKSINAMFEKYQITDRQRENARRLGVEIRLSANPSKKLDVFKDGKRIAQIGAKGYADYDVYLRERGREYAHKRRLLYKIRHAKNRKVKGSPGWYADRILW